MKYICRHVKTVEITHDIIIDASSPERAEEIFDAIKKRKDPRGTIWNAPSSSDISEKTLSEEYSIRHLQGEPLASGLFEFAELTFEAGRRLVYTEISELDQHDRKSVLVGDKAVFPHRHVKYTRAAFYNAACGADFGDRKPRLFRCLENNTVYVPGRHELLEWLGAENACRDLSDVVYELAIKRTDEKSLWSAAFYGGLRNQIVEVEISFDGPDAPDDFHACIDSTEIDTDNCVELVAEELGEYASACGLDLLSEDSAVKAVELTAEAHLKQRR